MNDTDPYLINLASSEYPQWQPARWIRESDIASFHIMRLDSSDSQALVLIHDSCIKPVKADTKLLEQEIRALLEYKQLTNEARKLIVAALEAQATGKMPDFLI